MTIGLDIVGRTRRRRIMGPVTKRLLIAGVCLAFLAYHMNVIVPDGIKDPTTYKLFFGVVRLASKTMLALEYLGFGQKIPLLQSLHLNIYPKVMGTTFKDNVTAVDMHFDGVEVRVYTPVDAALDGPGVVYLHGGGCAFGSVEWYDRLTRYWARKLNMVVISVEYRLAPQYIFPIPLDDCVTATKYFLKNAGKFGVDPERVAIAGDSAGGNLAAATSLKLRDEGFSPLPKAQVLIYPSLQGMDFQSPSMQEHGNEGIITRKDATEFYLNYLTGSTELATAFMENQHTPTSLKQIMAATYLNHEIIPEEYRDDLYLKPTHEHGDETIWEQLQHKLMNPYASPLMAKDLTNLPSSLVYTVGQDILRDDGIWYAERLKEAGNDVTYMNHESATHGMMSLMDLFEEGAVIADHSLDYIMNVL